VRQALNEDPVARHRPLPRVTGGVDVNGAPALVVLRPREHSELGVPVESVSYGFRGPASAEQAVRDALHDVRRDLPYHPR
jgi:hypothetical protein